MSKSEGLHNRIIAKNHEIVRKLRVSLERCAVLEIFRGHGMLAWLRSEARFGEPLRAKRWWCARSGTECAAGVIRWGHRGCQSFLKNYYLVPFLICFLENNFVSFNKSLNFNLVIRAKNHSSVGCPVFIKHAAVRM